MHSLWRSKQITDNIFQVIGDKALSVDLSLLLS